MAGSMGVPTHPYLLLALPDDPPSREVVRLHIEEADERIAISGAVDLEPLDLRTLICAPIKGQTIAGKVLELPAEHFLWREARRLVAACDHHFAPVHSQRDVLRMNAEGCAPLGCLGRKRIGREFGKEHHGCRLMAGPTA
ncbi:hypothetical protein [Methylobacterium sp. R2-1]|uniref:hypothetical protein n=1 Tax=Methylobacterium sp. R2-1 TaxID=2587064 RepID=UPI0016110335|nr:hypothetical protein [Methylobacterium sp. R2-1]MBB2963510.1 hypothetical protein [Methylobacterium sp. R2-1]